MTDFQQNALDALRDADATDDPERKRCLLFIAQGWLRLAQQIRQLDSEFEQRYCDRKILPPKTKKSRGSC